MIRTSFEHGRTHLIKICAVLDALPEAQLGRQRQGELVVLIQGVQVCVDIQYQVHLKLFPDANQPGNWTHGLHFSFSQIAILHFNLQYKCHAL